MHQTLPINTPWPLAQKLAFRFFFIFFIFYILSNPNGSVPLLNVTYRFYIQPVYQFITWCSVHIFHMPKQPDAVLGGSGSGDTTFNYLLLLLCTVVSFVGATIWSVTNSMAYNYDRLYYWLLVILRFYLGFTLMMYGSVKIIKLQFPYPAPHRLLEAYGDSSPMGLAWNFMGFSKGYNYFTGLAELSCGLLLLFRKTTTLGALIALVVSANIMAINYCFDVPVKLLSTMLVAMSLFILFKDFHRFVSFFFLNKPTEPACFAAKRFKTKWKNITLITAKYLLLFYMVACIIENCIQGSKNYGENAPKPSLYGIYNVETFVRNQDTIAPLITDSTRWRRLIFNRFNNAQVIAMNDSSLNYTLTQDSVTKLITLAFNKNPDQKYVLNYTKPKPDMLVISGKLSHDSVNITLRKYDDKKFLLMKRGFHWINEYPLNR
jgi:uncharacterized membrane protein YphA (DoxX/SURF4 family)